MEQLKVHSVLCLGTLQKLNRTNECAVLVRLYYPLQCGHELCQDLVPVSIPPHLPIEQGSQGLLLGHGRRHLLGLSPSHSPRHLVSPHRLPGAQHRWLVPRHAAYLVLLVSHEPGDRHSHLLYPATVGHEAPTTDQAEDHGRAHLLLGVLVSTYLPPHGHTSPLSCLFLSLTILLPSVFASSPSIA